MIFKFLEMHMYVKQQLCKVCKLSRHYLEFKKENTSDFSQLTLTLRFSFCRTCEQVALRFLEKTDANTSTMVIYFNTTSNYINLECNI